jgi:hypothetical protein
MINSGCVWVGCWWVLRGVDDCFDGVVVRGIVGVGGVDEEPSESRFQSSRFGWCWVLPQETREVERDFVPAAAG